jgi:hypothetical protein
MSDKLEEETNILAPSGIRTHNPASERPQTQNLKATAIG